MYKCLINNKSVAIRDGFTISEELNETLDSGTIQFITKGGEADIEAFDSIVITSDENSEIPIERKKQLIDTFDSEIESFGTTLENSDYFYTVNLFSETKILERVTLPNLLITSRASGTQKTVWQVVKDYCERYLQRYYYFDDTAIGNKILKPCLKYDEELETKLNMSCPEFSWDTPTLREVLNDLFSVADCLPIVKNNVLTYFDLTLKGSEIDTSKLSNKKVSGTSADYCDELTMPMQNVISNKPIKVIEYCGLKCNEGTLETENAFFATSKPIYKIVNATLYARVYKRQAPNDFYRVVSSNITDWIVEKNEYNVLLSKYKGWGSNNVDIRNYQIFHLAYERGKNNILDVIKNTEIRWYGDLQSSNYARANLVLGASLSPNHTLLEAQQNTTNNNFDDYIRDIFIKLEYETIDESTICVSRQRPIRNATNRIFDGQKTSMVDLQHQTIHEYLKINRLANKVQRIYGEYFDESDIPQLADTIGDKVLFSRSVTYYDNQLFFEGQLVDNYILRDYFTGVLAKRRTFALVDVNDASVRHDTYKFYVMACFDYGVFANANIYTITPMPNFAYGLNTILTLREPMQIGYYFQSTRDKHNNWFPNSQDFYALDASFNAGGMSIIIDAGFNDNLTAGYYVTKDDGTLENNIYRYGDEDGECVFSNIVLANSYNAGDGDFDFEQYLEDLSEWEYDSDFDEDKYNALVEKARTKPKISWDGIDRTKGWFSIVINGLNKDNREILKSTIQFEFLSNDPRIILTSEFVKHSAYLLGSGSASLRFYHITNDKFKPSETKARGTRRLLWVLTEHERTASAPSYILVNFGLIQPSENDAYCVCDANDNILFAINGNNNRIYFDVRYTRDDNVYNSQIDKIAIGKINETTELEDKQIPTTIDSFKVLNRTIEIDDTKDF